MDRALHGRAARNHVEDQSQRGCWGDARLTAPDGALAAYVRDNPATAPGQNAFTMLDLAHSAIAADDPTVIYRAHLFPLVSLPITAANVPPIEAELARREDFGNVFDATYLNRDIVCLGCHNSERSVTDSTDPARDRHWPLDGNVDLALYGMAAGEAPAVAHAMFRVDGFVDRFGATRPWGMVEDCGTFTDPASLPVDPADIDGHFGTLMGKQLTVFDLDLAMKRGFDHLRGTALAVAARARSPTLTTRWPTRSPPTWSRACRREVIGSRLTIANYFPRNQAARDEPAAPDRSLHREPVLARPVAGRHRHLGLLRAAAPGGRLRRRSVHLPRRLRIRGRSPTAIPRSTATGPATRSRRCRRARSCRRRTPASSGASPRASSSGSTRPAATA